jgi:hypothetical protein
MGTRNWQTLRDLTIAKRAGRTEEVAALTAVLEESQRACKHPDVDKRVGTCHQDVETAYRGTVHKGDEIVWCFACSRILRHTPKAHP